MLSFDSLLTINGFPLVMMFSCGLGLAHSSMSEKFSPLELH